MTMIAGGSSHTIAGFGCGRRTNTIAVIQPVLSDSYEIPSRIPRWGPDEEVDWWTRRALCGLNIGAEETGFGFLWRVWVRGEGCDAIAQDLFPTHADAAILLAPRQEHLPLAHILAEVGIPCVVAFTIHADPHIPWVDWDGVSGGVQVIKHLYHLGHRRIGLVANPRAVTEVRKRGEGFRAGLEAVGLAYDPSLVVAPPDHEYSHDFKVLVARLLQ